MNEPIDGGIASPHPATAVIRVARRGYRFDRYGRAVLGALGILLALVAWELYSRFGPVDASHLPPPSVVLPTWLRSLGFAEYWAAVGATLWSWFLGVVISSALAIVVGVIIGSSRFLRTATHSTIELLRPIPSVGLIPIAALLFGPRIGAELMIVVYGCFWLVLIQVLYGIADVDKVANETVRTFGMSWWQRARYLVLPTLLPYLVTGLRLAATVALILAISTELIIGTAGLGRQVALAQLNDAPDAMLTFILTAGALGILFNIGMRFAERKILFWHASVRGERAA